MPSAAEKASQVENSSKQQGQRFYDHKKLACGFPLELVEGRETFESLNSDCLIVRVLGLV